MQQIKRFSLILLIATSAVGNPSIGYPIKTSDLPEILNQAKEMALSVSPGSENIRTLARIGTTQAKVGDVQGALKTLSLIPNEFRGDKGAIQSSLKSHIAQAQARAGDIQDALSMAQLISQDIIQANTRGAISILQAHQGDLQGALKTATSIGDKYSARHSAILRIAKWQSESDDLHGAFSTALLTADEDAATFWDITSHQVKKGNVKIKHQIVSSIQNEDQQNYALWGLIKAKLEVHEIESSEKIAMEITLGHARASALVDIAKAQVEMGQMEKALKNLGRALVNAKETNNLWAKADLLWNLSLTQAKAGDVENAVKIALGIKTPGHRNSALRDIAVVQANRGDIAGAQKTAAHFSGEFAFPHPQYYIFLAQAKNGDVHEALQGAKKLQGDLKDIAFSGIACAQAQTGDIKGALKTVESISDEEMSRTMTIHRISGIQLDKGDINGAAKTLLTAPKGHLVPSNFTQIITALIEKNNDLSGALWLADSLSYKPYKNEVLQQISKTLAHRGESAKAVILLESAESKIEKANILVSIVEGMLTPEQNNFVQ